jgi:hypothetical protein
VPAQRCGFEPHRAVKVRGSTFRGYLGLELGAGNGSTYDLGVDNDHGRNTFYNEAYHLIGLRVWSGENIVVNAVGNEWAPGVQDANGYGRYEERRVIRGPVEGKNVTIESTRAEVRL